MKTYLEYIEIQKIIDAADNMRDKLLIRLLSRLGCRITELLSIEDRNIDWDRRLIMIRHLKTSGTKKQCPGCNKKVGGKVKFCSGCGRDLSEVNVTTGEPKFRLVPVDAETLRDIKNYLENRRSNGSRLFPITRQMAYFIIRRASELAGLGGEILTHPNSGKNHFIHPHAFRDSLAVRWLNTKSDMAGQKALQEYLGHQSFNTTARYFKVAPDHTSKIYEEIFGGDCNV